MHTAYKTQIVLSNLKFLKRGGCISNAKTAYCLLSHFAKSESGFVSLLAEGLGKHRLPEVLCTLEVGIDFGFNTAYER